MLLTAKILKLTDGFYVIVFGEEIERDEDGRIVPEIEMGPYEDRATAEAVAEALTAE